MITPIERNFLSKDFKITTINGLKPYLQQLLDYHILSKEDLYNFLKKLSEFEAVVSEEACWRQIKITTDTANKTYQEEFEYFVTHIQPQLQIFSNKINNKIINSDFTKDLNDSFFTTLRNIKTKIELFSENNIAINSDIALLQQQYGEITSKMTVLIDDKEYTLQQASLFLKEPDAQKRKEVYFKIQERRFEGKDALNNLYNILIQKRNLISANKNYKNYTEYRFKELHRYEYDVKDCEHFHQGIKKYFLPLVNKLYKIKKQQSGLDVLKPWDLDAPELNKKSLSPFKTIDELKNKTKKCLNKIDPFFYECINEMDEMKRLDLESRKGKAPGGYNCPLPETGAPFIFMNAVGTLDDVITIVHEAGHAVHSFLAHQLPYTSFKEYNMEIAELASMSMEMFSLSEWHIFFDNPQELKRATFQQWERVLIIFPWIAIIDKFQHYIYNKPNDTTQQRNDEWQKIFKEFSSTEIDYLESTKYMPYTWQKQLHLFEVPFYYIEYGIAQLGALAMYKNYKQDKNMCLENYKKALSLGGTKTLAELYKSAGIQLKFDDNYLKEIAQLVEAHIDELK